MTKTGVDPDRTGVDPGRITDLTDANLSVNMALHRSKWLNSSHDPLELHWKEVRSLQVQDLKSIRCDRPGPPIRDHPSLLLGWHPPRIREQGPVVGQVIHIIAVADGASVSAQGRKPVHEDVRTCGPWARLDHGFETAPVRSRSILYQNNCLICSNLSLLQNSSTIAHAIVPRHVPHSHQTLDQQSIRR